LLRKHEITVEVYEEMFERQSGKCKICGTTDPGHKRKYLAVDHNHETGDIRGLLCYQCNLGLGHFQDDTAILQKAILYLSTNQT
jgi:nitrate/TMAO reductase-like tetraheme cytochrome c subunit